MDVLSKQSQEFQEMKDYINKSNQYPNITVSDDLQILEIVNNKNLEIELLFYSYDVEYQNKTKELLNSLINKAKRSFQISNKMYQQLSLKENHAGIIAAIKLPIDEDIYNKEFLIVLDHLEIPGNIGTIYRTLDSVKADGVILVDSISKVNNPKITSSSRGCNLIIPSAQESYNDALNKLLKNNYTIFLGEPILGLNYQEYDYSGKIAIVVGNERFGINPDWYNHNHKKVYIPMEGNQNSLNVGVAASILAYEAYMKRKNK